jgi:hypothetical protein
VDVPLSIRREIAVEDEIGPEAKDRFGDVGAGDALLGLPKRIAYLCRG